MNRTVASLLAIGLFCPLAHADKITMKDGRSYEGKLIRDGVDDVSLEVIIMGKTVVMTVMRADISLHEKTVSIKEQYEDKALKLPKNNASAQVDLATWCKDNGLMDEAFKHLVEATIIDPNNKMAERILKALGYVFSGGKWITEVEHKKSQGLEKYNDRWIPREEAERLRAEADAKRKEKADEDKRIGLLGGVNRDLGKAERALASMNAEYAQLARDAKNYQARLQALWQNCTALEQKAEPLLAQSEALKAQAAQVEAWTMAMTGDTMRTSAAGSGFRGQASSLRKSAENILRDANNMRLQMAAYDQKLRFTLSRMRVLEEEYAKKQVQAEKLQDKKDNLEK